MKRIEGQKLKKIAKKAIPGAFKEKIISLNMIRDASDDSLGKTPKFNRKVVTKEGKY